MIRTSELAGTLYAFDHAQGGALKRLAITALVGVVCVLGVSSILPAWGRGDSTPTVSIITPTYNSGPLLQHTVRSVSEQTFDDWELLLIDDASTDGTSDVVDWHASTDRRVRAFHMPNNGGVSIARNAGLDAARGTYVAFLDHDDLWLPKKLEKQLAFMRAGNHTFTFTGMRALSCDGARQSMAVPVTNRVTYQGVMRHRYMPMSSVMVSRTWLGHTRFAEDVQRVEDIALFADMLRHGDEARGLNEPLTLFRLTEGSVSRNKLRMARARWRLMRDREHRGMLSALFDFGAYIARATWRNKVLYHIPGGVAPRAPTGRTEWGRSRRFPARLPSEARPRQRSQQ